MVLAVVPMFFLVQSTPDHIPADLVLEGQQAYGDNKVDVAERVELKFDWGGQAMYFSVRDNGGS